jgi:sulfoxide reductase heme-binding subunit YedZ
MSQPRWSKGQLARAAVFAGCCLPLALMASEGLGGRLGANSIATIMNRLGFWALFILLLSLAATPLKILFGWTSPLRFRRMVGLFAFFYASLHLTTYVAIDQFFDLPAIAADIVKRKFITIGLSAFLLLVPLAITSTDRWVRRLGFVRWKRVHRLSYLAAVCGVIHFVWRVKADLLQPTIFGLVLAGLFAVRLFPPRIPRPRAAAARAFSEGTAGP